MSVFQSTIEEGTLTFTFPRNAIASKYDGWSHYKNQFQSVCGGSKAVDLVYIAEGVSWLIEVKDYRRHQRTKVIDLADELAVKVRDTLAGLVSASLYANDTEEKRYAGKLLGCRRLRVVCHIEQPLKHSRLRPRAIEPDKLLLKLRPLIKAIDSHPSVVDRHSLGKDMAWSVA